MLALYKCMFKQSRTMTNTVHSILQNNLKGTVCSKDAERLHGKLRPNKQQQMGILT